MTQNLMQASSSLPKVLVSQAISATESAQYTVPADSSAKIASASLSNTSTAAVNVSVSLVPSGGSAGNGNRVVSNTTLLPNDSTVVSELLGAAIGPGDFISAVATPTTQTVTLSGSPTALTLAYDGSTTSSIATPTSATSDQIRTALGALPSLPGGVSVTGPNGGPWTVFLPSNAKMLTGSATGGTSPGVTIAAVPAVAFVVSGVVFS